MGDVSANWRADSLPEPTWEYVTPARAAELLEHNHLNRAIRQNRVTEFVELIGRGEWEPTHQGVAMDAEGNLLDGQHRLWAIVESGTALPMMITRGLSRSAINVIDIGARRTSSDTLKIKGEAGAHRLAPALGFLWRYENGAMRDAKLHPTNKQLGEVLLIHPGIRGSIGAPSLLIPHTRMLPPGLIVWLHYEFTHIDDAKAELFFDRLGSGEELAAGSPILVLRNRLMAALLSRNASRVTVAALSIKAWNAYLEGRNVASLSWTASQDFPQIKGRGGKHGGE